MGYPSSLAPALSGHSTRLLRCLFDSSIFDRVSIRARVFHSNAKNNGVDYRVTYSHSINLATFQQFLEISASTNERLATISVPGNLDRSCDFNFQTRRRRFRSRSSSSR